MLCYVMLCVVNVCKWPDARVTGMMESLRQLNNHVAKNPFQPNNLCLFWFCTINTKTFCRAGLLMTLLVTATLVP